MLRDWMQEAKFGVLRYPNGTEHPVVGWLNYGVVMPSVATTNGSATYAAEVIESLLARLPGATFVPADPVLYEKLGLKQYLTEMYRINFKEGK